jgi:hypothetical protein
MRRVLVSCAVVLPLALLMTTDLRADVRTRERSLVKFEGMLGRMIGMFGGKAAKEGIISTTAVKGNRKATMNENTGQIVDLSEEKIYDLDLKKKQYEVTTFDELRKRMREAEEKAQKEAAKEEGKPEKAEKPSGEPEKQMEVDFDVKETGEKKQIAGYDTREEIITITVREKGKTLDESGGLVMTSDSWLGPEIPALKEVAAFEMKYWKQLAGPVSSDIPADQMAMVMAMYPLLKQGMERMAKEGDKLKGTTLASTTTFEGVKSKAQMATDEQQSASGGGGGGIGGMLARKVMKKEPAKQRTLFMTVTHEIQEVATSVSATDLEIPAGFKEKK